MKFELYKKFVESLAYGKQLSDAVYLHESLLAIVPDDLATFIYKSADQYADGQEWNLVKLFRRDFRMSLLHYPNFDDHSYPALRRSISVDLVRRISRATSYKNSLNPPILHRKELLVHPSYPARATFVDITKEGEELGIYEKSSGIGFKKSWEKRIFDRGYDLVDGRLVPKANRNSERSGVSSDIDVKRHRTAINRDKLSSPMQGLSKYGYLNGDYTVLDYGCGRGDDVRELAAHGLDVAAWDPVYRPDGAKRASDVVNLGFVVNVIEEKRERVEALCAAFALATSVLAVSAMVAGPSTVEKYTPYKDGVITSRDTFQKYYTQSELRSFIESSLDRPPVAISPGLFFVFSDPLEEQRFLSTRQRVSRTWRQLTTRERVGPAIDHQKVLVDNLAIGTDFWTTCLDFGRAVANDEYERSAELRRLFGSHKRAFEACLEYFGPEDLNSARFGRIEDMTVYLALSFFGGRQAHHKLPKSLQRDIKAFFGSMTTAQELAREALFSIAHTDRITKACMEARERLDCGHLHEEGAYIFQSRLLNRLPCVLRIYVGCASQLYGDIEHIDLIKIHMDSGKVSLMVYDDFQKPLPLLKERIKVRLRDQEIDWFHYGGAYDAQPLYLKSLYLADDDPEFATQEAFDRAVSRLPGFEMADYGPSLEEFKALWTAANRKLVDVGL